MLIKIDHVSYSCDGQFDYKIFYDMGYDTEFCEERLENIECKKNLLKYKAELHNIYMLTKEDRIPIEITMYDRVDKIDTGLSLNGNTLEWKVCDIGKAEEFLMLFGAKKEKESELILKGFFDKAPLRIKLTENYNKNEPYLDIDGFSSLGLVVDNVNRELVKMKGKGYFVTDVNEIIVNKKKMEIGFVVGENNEIIELISVGKSE